jgi:hypothetical protein
MGFFSQLVNPKLHIDDQVCFSLTRHAAAPQDLKFLFYSTLMRGNCTPIGVILPSKLRIMLCFLSEEELGFALQCSGKCAPDSGSSMEQVEQQALSALRS